MRILVIEDEADLCKLYKVWLDAEHELTICNDGFSGALTILRGNFDLVICDLKLPGKTGDEIVKLFKGKETEKSDCTPIIIVSGYLTPELKNEFSLYKKVFTLDKPVSRQEFLGIIDSL